MSDRSDDSYRRERKHKRHHHKHHKDDGHRSHRHHHHRRRSRSRSPHDRRRHERDYGRDRDFGRRGWREEPPFKRRRDGSEERKLLEDRDKRTVFVYQLHPKANEDDLKKFFSKAGEVRDVRLISDRKTGRSKGIAYIEFTDPLAVGPALGMQGVALHGHPVMVKQSESEKNAFAAPPKPASRELGPMTKLYMGGFGTKVSEGELLALCGKVAAVESFKLERETDGKSKGYGYAKFKTKEDAKLAATQLMGAEIGGLKLKVGLVSDTTVDATAADTEKLDDEEIGISAGQRAMLMARLQGVKIGVPSTVYSGAGVTGYNAYVPGTTLDPLMTAIAPQPQATATLTAQVKTAAITVPVAKEKPREKLPPPNQPSACLVLKNLFDPEKETEPDWDEDIKEDVCEECTKCGRIQHVWVDKTSKGCVYLKFDGADGAIRTYQKMNKRWFSKRQVIAEYIPVAKYNENFGL